MFPATKNTSADKDDLCCSANKAGHKLREYLDTAGDDIGQVSEKVENQIRSKPVQSSLIALGIGFVLGSLFRR